MAFSCVVIRMRLMEIGGVVMACSSHTPPSKATARETEMSNSFNQAEAYESNQSSYQRENGKRLIELLAPKKGDRILDVGCGTGYITKLLAEAVGPKGKVVGVDPDLDRLKIAKEQYPAENVEYVEGTAECIPVEDSAFDIAFSNYVLHWCKDKDMVFEQVARKLKPGGKFGLVAVHWEEMFEVALVPAIVSQDFIDAFARIFHSVGLDQYQQSASKYKFEVLTGFKHVEHTKHKDVPDLIEFFMTHLGGKYDKTHFNVEAMKQKYGEGEFCLDKDIVTCIMKLSDQ